MASEDSLKTLVVETSVETPLAAQEVSVISVDKENNPILSLTANFECEQVVESDEKCPVIWRLC